MDSTQPDNIVNDIVTIPGRNGGTLTAGNPGNKGGKGRPKSEIRDIAAETFAEALPILRAIAFRENGQGALTQDQLRAIDLLGKYGGLQQVDQTTGDKPIETTKIEFGSMSVDERRKLLENLPE